MQSFTTLFGFPPEARGTAPGRVNILGEHTDYNEGFVLPVAITQTTTVEVALSRSDAFLVHSASQQPPGSIVSYRSDEPLPEGFARYVVGCIRVLVEDGIRVPPVAMSIRSTVPIGAGLSSSAALEVATLRALRELLELPLDDVQIALAAQRAEVDHVGVRCGIMDQMAASLAEPARMLFLDTRTLQRRLVPFPAGASAIVIDSR